MTKKTYESNQSNESISLRRNLLFIIHPFSCQENKKYCCQKIVPSTNNVWWRFVLVTVYNLFHNSSNLLY